jgi:hypothetical protein
MLASKTGTEIKVNEQNLKILVYSPRQGPAPLKTFFKNPETKERIELTPENWKKIYDKFDDLKYPPAAEVVEDDEDDNDPDTPENDEEDDETAMNGVVPDGYDPEKEQEYAPDSDKDDDDETKSDIALVGTDGPGTGATGEPGLKGSENIDVITDSGIPKETSQDVPPESKPPVETPPENKGPIGTVERVGKKKR